MRGTGKARIPASAAAPAGNHQLLAGLSEIKNDFTRIGIADDTADRHAQDGVCAVATLAIAAFAMGAALGLMFRIETEVNERIVLLSALENDGAAASTVTAAGAAARHVLLPPERQAAIAAIARFDCYDSLVNEHLKLPS